MQTNIDPTYLREQGLSESFPERFWKRVFITPTHWLWDGNRRAPMNHGSIWRGVKNDRGTYAGNIYAHVAAWILCRGPIPEGLFVLHKCPGKHIPWCVCPDHLALGTQAENSQDMIQQGTSYFYKGHNHSAKGEHNPASKLTECQVLEIRARYSGKMGEQNTLAAEYGVTQSSIWNILTGRNWKSTATGIVPALIAKSERLKTEKNSQKRVFPIIGDNNPTSKLTNEQRRQILEKYTGKRGQQSQLAREYAVSQGTIWNVINHRVHIL